MIKVICKDNKIVYNAYHLVKAFLPERDVTSELNEGQAARICLEGEEYNFTAEDIKELYSAMNRISGKKLPWGMLTGVRPTKLASKWIDEEIDKYLTREEAEKAFREWFYEDRFVSREKADTAFNVAMKERALMPADLKGGYSLYVGIPFCPTVCSYCSFSSGAISEYKDKVEGYLDALCSELTMTAASVPEMLRGAEKLQNKQEDYKEKITAKIYPTTIYMGGGTPTSLSADQLDRLLLHMDKLFDIPGGLKNGKIREYTIEAGRPDSITREKLQVIKKHGVTRISINPQTMQQKTLDIIGRKHTVEQIRETFALARELGFDNINMDMIVGLTGESNEDVRDTLRQISELSPDSLTVHSLALKRSSALGIAKRTGKSDEEIITNEKADISQMISDAMAAAKDMGMDPYYLYRQKSIAGNFENVGYAKPGREGLYNVLIMEEVQSIIACGAGASTKIVTEEAVPNPKRKGQPTHLIRSENVKNIDDYIRKYKNED